MLLRVQSRLLTSPILFLTDVAFVITTDFATGSYSVIDSASRNTFTDIVPVVVSRKDALARS